MSTTSFSLATAPAKDMAAARALGRRRRLVDQAVRLACVPAKPEKPPIGSTTN
jgi:hypothetical protein